jgi:hypothetical protein
MMGVLACLAKPGVVLTMAPLWRSLVSGAAALRLSLPVPSALQVTSAPSAGALKEQVKSTEAPAASVPLKPAAGVHVAQMPPSLTTLTSWMSHHPSSAP